jgi:CBS domain-containing protein
MTVGNCGRCREFGHIEFDSNQQLVLRCGARCARGRSGAARVQEAVRVPAVCSAPDTTLSVALSGSTLISADDVIPVLDLDSRPIGFVTARELNRLVCAGVPLSATLSEVMCRQIVCALPETSIFDAHRLLGDTGAAQLFIVGADGAFLGLVIRSDLARVA